MAVVAKLLPGSRERATQILAEGAPYGRELAGELVVDPTRSAAFSVWGPLLDGTPVLAQDEFFWNPTSDELHKLRVDSLCEPWWLRLLAFMGERYERFLLETAHLEALDHEGASR